MSISASTIRKIIALGLSKKATNSVLEILAGEQEAEEIRLKKQRDRTARCRARNVTVTLPSQLQEKGGIYVEPMDVKTIDVELTEVPLNQVPVKSGAREAEFEAFWEAYPRSEGRQAALKSYLKARKQGVTSEEILAGVFRLTAAYGPDYGFYQHGATWLNGKRWNDQIKENQNGRRGRESDIIRSAKNYIEAARMFEDRPSADLFVRGGTGSPHVRMLQKG